MKMVFGLALLAASPVVAQTPPAMLECAGIAVNAQRLACYDKAVASTSSEAMAISKRRAVETARLERDAAAAAAIAANEAARVEAEARRQAFGSRAGYAQEAAERITKVEAAVKSTILAQTGSTVVILDNGQVWAQLESRGTPSIRTGDKVIVERNAFGGFELTLVRQKRTFQVKRLN